MPLSSHTYAGDGSTRQFAVTFPYLDKASVTATVNGVPTSFSWFNNSTIEFVSAPTSGVAVVLTRHTSIDEARVDFSDGSNIVAADLDGASQQVLYGLQELKDRTDFYISYWSDLIIGGGDLPPSSAGNDFLIGSGSGSWNVKTVEQTRTILGIDTIDSSSLLPDPNGVAGVLLTAGTSWIVSGIKPTRAFLNLGDMAVHNIADFSNAILTPVGTDIGDLVQLENVGDAPGLPAVDGSQLTNVAREQHILFFRKAAYNADGGTYASANAWVDVAITDKIVDETGDADIDTGQIVVPAGKYRVLVRTAMNLQGHNLCRIMSGSSVIATGPARFNNDDEQDVQLLFEDTFSVETTLKLQVRSTGSGSSGPELGNPHGQSGLGDNIYTEIHLWKLPV